MRLFAENFNINFDCEKSYPDFPQSFPQNKVKKNNFKKTKAALDFNLPVNYCPYLLLEICSLLDSKLKSSCFQLEVELFCCYNNQTFQISISSKKGALCLNQIRFELEKYLRKLNLSNPISSVEINMIEGDKKLSSVSHPTESKYDVFTSVNFQPTPEDYYLGLVKLDLDTRRVD